MKLKIDWDGRPMTRAEFDNRLRTILRMLKLEEARVTEYSTRHGKHIYVDLDASLEAPAENALLVLLFQFALGSDGWRELFNIERVLQGMPIEEANVLFSSKWRNKEKVSEEKFITERIVSVSENTEAKTEFIKKTHTEETPCQD